MRVDIFSDVICPWCFIGKRRLERALAERPQPGIEIRWRAFQLNPRMPAAGMPRQLYLRSKFGGPERARRTYETIRAVGEKVGIAFDFERIRRTPNTVRAHRLAHHARRSGRGEAVIEGLFTGYFQEGIDIGEDRGLIAIAEAAGLDPGDAEAFLAGEEGMPEVWSETRFAYESGISGVPCFIVNRRYALSGAQEPEAFFPLFDLGRQEQPAANQA